MINRIINSDCIEGLKKMPDGCVDCCVTSPPYFGLRDYGKDGQIGLEASPELFVAKMVEVFTEVRRVLKKEGVLWLNLGDSYCGTGTGTGDQSSSTLKGSKSTQIEAGKRPGKSKLPGLKQKDLIGIPWMVAFALRSSGWYLRQDIIWHKKNCMPESVTDRCTKNHEYIFLLSKSAKYYFDSEAIQEDAVWDVDGTGTLKRKLRQTEENKSNPDEKRSGIRKVYTEGKNEQSIKAVNGKRNKRSVWSYPTAQFPDAHFATFPEDLIVDCIKAGCPEGGIVLDPFMGAGTTALVASKLNRKYVGFELNEDYIRIAEKRLQNELGMFNSHNAA
jgi:DNA modification methylase